MLRLFVSLCCVWVWAAPLAADNGSRNPTQWSSNPDTFRQQLNGELESARGANVLCGAGGIIFLTEFRNATNRLQAAAGFADQQLVNLGQQCEDLMAEIRKDPAAGDFVEDFEDSDSLSDGAEAVGDFLEQLTRTIDTATQVGDAIQGVRPSTELIKLKQKVERLNTVFQNKLKFEAALNAARQGLIDVSNAEAKCLEPIDNVPALGATAGFEWSIRPRASIEAKLDWNKIYFNDRYAFSGHLDSGYEYADWGGALGGGEMGPRFDFSGIDLEWRPITPQDPRIVPDGSPGFDDSEFHIRIEHSYKLPAGITPFLRYEIQPEEQPQTDPPKTEGTTGNEQSWRPGFGDDEAWSLGVGYKLGKQWVDNGIRRFQNTAGDPLPAEQLDGVIIPFDQNLNVIRLQDLIKYDWVSRYGIQTLHPLDLVEVKPVCHETAGTLLGGADFSQFHSGAAAYGHACSPTDSAQRARDIQEGLGRAADAGYEFNESLAFTYYYGGIREGGFAGAGWCGFRLMEYEQQTPTCGLAEVEGLEGAELRGVFIQPTVGALPPLGAVARKGHPNDRYFHAKGSWGKKYPDQWGLRSIGFEPKPDGESSWPTQGKPVVVAVIDTGIDFGHPELFRRFWYNADEVPSNGKDDDKNGFVDDVFGWNFLQDSDDVRDDHGHGTFVAGIIAARSDNGIGVAGINPWARIMPLKVARFNGETDSIYVARAIYYAVQNGAKVINVSIGGRTLTVVERNAIAAANELGAIVVVAAGNSSVNTVDISPAGLPGAITVAATGPDGKRAKFSNWGDAVDISAPGVEILSLRAMQTDMHLMQIEDYKPRDAFVGGDTLYYLSSGTSFSAPMVAGVASLLLSARPELTPQQVKRMILNSARDLEVPGVDQWTGYGALDAAAALVADPEYFVEARIDGASAVRVDGQMVLQVVGRAAADRFARAWLEAGQGEEPKKWKKISDELGQAVDAGVLANVPPKNFKGGKVWTLRVIVEHEDGSQREARFRLQLG